MPLLAAGFGMLLGACSGDETRGQLMLAFQADMALPQQLDTVLVQVTLRGGHVQYSRAYRVGADADQFRVPGTLALIAGDDPLAPLTISVAGGKSDHWRTLREITTSVPRDRTAELRMPLQWLCDESAEPEAKVVRDDAGNALPEVRRAQCEEGTTCMAGRCSPNTIASETLPDYAAADSFGGAQTPEDGACFDTLACLSSGVPVEPDDDCTLARPTGDKINIGLRVAAGGICDAGDTSCFVPLDGRSDEGWAPTPDGLRLQLPAAVCDRLAQRKVLAVYLSTACASKRESQPPCGAWSSVPANHAIRPPEALIAPWPSAELITELLEPGARVCCPLVRAGDKLYTCGCPSDASANAALYELAPGAKKPMAYALDARPGWSSTVFQGALYWAGEGKVLAAQLAAHAQISSYDAPGGLYTDGVLLADEHGVYALTSGVDTSENDPSPVKLVQVGFDHSTQQFALGNRAVRQFAQDESAFYAVINRDQWVPDGEAFERASSVVRIDKKTHASTVVLDEKHLKIVDRTFHGYLGLVSDGSTLFASFASAADTDGRSQLQILRVPNARSAGPSSPAPVYQISVPVSPRTTSVRLLGASQGALVFARDEYESTPLRLRSSSVIVLPDGSTTPRYVADFVADSPAPGFASDSERIYWLNNSGALFGLERSSLGAAP